MRTRNLFLNGSLPPNATGLWRAFPAGLARTFDYEHEHRFTEHEHGGIVRHTILMAVAVMRVVATEAGAKPFARRQFRCIVMSVVVTVTMVVMVM